MAPQRLRSAGRSQAEQRIQLQPSTSFKVKEMSLSSYRRKVLIAALVLPWASSASCADVYKWVDEKGQTHYSQRNDSAGKTKTEQLKISAPQPSASAPVAADLRGSAPDWFARPTPAPTPVETRPAPSRAAPQPRRDAIETDASRCQLARDVLSGAVKHTNGARTDANDRQVAESDIRLFCGK
jgi:hypothetical protein